MNVLQKANTNKRILKGNKEEEQANEAIKKSLTTTKSVKFEKAFVKTIFVDSYKKMNKEVVEEEEEKCFCLRCVLF